MRSILSTETATAAQYVERHITNLKMSAFPHGFIALGLTVGTLATAAPLDYNFHIRPILSDNCFACHGPDKDARKARLRLDNRDSATAPAKSGLIAITPGSLSESELIARITSDDEEERMPPKDAHKVLKPEEIARLKQWIAEGAVYARHWAFEPLLKADIPIVTHAPASGNAVDRFILARLEAEGLHLSPEAEKPTLLRRVTLDLTGLPPTPVEIDAFQSDTSPQAYENVVERLLGSPHYGERMALDWLDAARYADTDGYQADRDRDMYAWRDWVIQSFNENKSFDVFTIEQLAGDLLPNPTIDQKIATGFNRNQTLNLEGGVIAEEFLAEYAADRVETTSTVWLGATLGCARCHDHKFDPFTQKDFYSLKAFFHNSSEANAADSKRSKPPFVKLPAPEIQAKLSVLRGQIADTQAREAKISAPPERLSAWAERLAQATVEWHPTEPTAVNAGTATSGIDPSGKRVRIGGGVGLGTYDIALTVHTPLTKITALRLMCGSVEPEATLQLKAIRVKLASKTGAVSKPLTLHPAEADDSLKRSSVAAILDTSDSTLAAIQLKSTALSTIALELDSALDETRPIDLEIVVTIRSADSDTVWSVEATNAEPDLIAPTAAMAAARVLPDAWANEERNQLVDTWTSRLPERRQLVDRIASLNLEVEGLEKQIPTTMVMDEMSPRKTFVLMRGAYDQPGEEVFANTPAALPPMGANLPRDRLGLARWLTDPTNPLPARVTVNRFWQSLFGNGLVRTADNFGSQGEPPTHPELLDWLSLEFIRSGWDVKATMRSLVMSATYRQSSRLTPALRDRDPENRLLARGSRFRLPAEFVRDQALAASGLLVEKIGGPSVKPYHPAGLYEQIGYDQKAVYAQGKGDDLYRRSLYTYWKRSIPSPTMTVFDAPFRETCTIRRPRTNTPLQALALMNDPTFVEAARFLAQRMLLEGGATITSKLTLGFRLATARLPRSEELAVLLRAWERAFKDFQSDAQGSLALLSVGETRSDAALDRTQLAALTIVASSILNLDEIVTKE